MGVMQAVAKNGLALAFVSAELRGDREVVMEAVANDDRQASEDASVFEHASEALRGDREVVLQAVEKNGWALGHASAELRRDREVVMAAILQNARALRYAAQELQSDEGFKMRVTLCLLMNADKDP